MNDGTSRWDPQFRGHPNLQLGNFATPKVKQRKIRCLVANFYVDGKQAVEGKTYEVGADLAVALVGGRNGLPQRAEYAE